MNDLDCNKITAEVITKFSTKVMGMIFNKIKDKIDDGVKKMQIDYQNAFIKYLKEGVKKYSVTKTLLYRDKPKYLYDFFEPSNVKNDGNLISSNDVNNIIDISNYLVLTGTGGIGKSTLLKHFYLNSIKRTLFIPILFELKMLNRNTLSLLNHLYNQIHNLGFSMPIEYFEYALQSGHFVILLDGYDELDTHRNVAKEIEDFVDKYDTNHYIISSRPSDNFISWNRFSIIKTQPLKKEQALNLIMKIDYDQDLKNRFIKSLESGLYDKHQSFASNPLLLNIMLLTYEMYAEVPDKLHVFYANAFETLLTKHDATKGGYKRALKSKLSSEDFKKVISEFSFKSYIKSMTTLTITDIESIFKTISLLKGIEFENVLKDMVANLCLLYTEGLYYRYTHRSFQEYFTAVFIKDLDDKLQSELFATNFKKRIIEDSVFNMLYDMSGGRIEKNVILPFLEDCFIKTDDGQNFAILFSLFYSYVRVTVIDTGEQVLVYGISNGHNIKMRNFIANKYGLIPMKSNSKIDIEDYIINKYGLDVELNLDMILKDKILLTHVEKNLKNQYDSLKHAQEIIISKNQEFSDDIYRLLS